MKNCPCCGYKLENREPWMDTYFCDCCDYTWTAYELMKNDGIARFDAALKQHYAPALRDALNAQVAPGTHLAAMQIDKDWAAQREPAFKTSKPFKLGSDPNSW